MAKIASGRVKNESERLSDWSDITSGYLRLRHLARREHASAKPRDAFAAEDHIRHLSMVAYGGFVQFCSSSSLLQSPRASDISDFRAVVALRHL